MAQHDPTAAVTGLDSFPPSAFNPNAFNLISYRRPRQENTILYFPTRPESGLNTLEELIKASGADYLAGSEGERAFKQAGDEAARVDIKSADAPRGTVVPFLESVYPSAALFNSGTGAWSSAQVDAALATVDRVGVFRALADIPGQEQAGIVVESPNALTMAARALSSKTSNKVMLASSLSPSCMGVQEATIEEILASPVAIFQAASRTVPGHRLILRPFTGVNVGEREILCDGIVAGGKIVFSQFSEKHRVDREPPYMDRRIATVSELDDQVAAGIREIVEAVLTRLGVRNAVFHSEHSLTQSGAILTDLMTRPGGGFIPEMVAAKTGVDLRAAHVYAAFGMEDELVRLSGGGKDAGGAVAIAACYAKEEGRPMVGAADGLIDSLERDERVLAFNVETTASNATVGLPDIRASVAVKGSSAGGALSDLDKLVGEYGLE